MTFQVLSVLDIIDPGLNKDRGTMLRELAATQKLILQRKMLSGEIGEEEFSAGVQDCVQLFNQSQECIVMKVKRPLPTSNKEQNSY